MSRSKPLPLTDFAANFGARRRRPPAQLVGLIEHRCLETFSGHGRDMCNPRSKESEVQTSHQVEDTAFHLAMNNQVLWSPPGSHVPPKIPRLRVRRMCDRQCNHTAMVWPQLHGMPCAFWNACDVCCKLCISSNLNVAFNCIAVRLQYITVHDPGMVSGTTLKCATCATQRNIESKAAVTAL